VDPAVSRRKFERELECIRTQAAGFIEAAAWDVVDATYPVLAVVFTHPGSKRRVGFRFLCDDWDELPPSLSLFHPETGQELPWDKWPQQGWSAGNPHPTTGKPFLCLPGIREYHIHSSHLGDKWDNLRGRQTYSLRYILHRVQSRFGDTNG
jgi:Predicted metal binding domain